MAVLVDALKQLHRLATNVFDKVEARVRGVAGEARETVMNCASHCTGRQRARPSAAAATQGGQLPSQSEAVEGDEAGGAGHFLHEVPH